MAVAVAVDDDIGRPEVGRDRVAHTAQVDGAHPSDPPVGRSVRVTAAHDIGVVAGEQRFEVVIRDVGRDAGAVVRSR
jgi:hypothetical protein